MNSVHCRTPDFYIREENRTASSVHRVEVCLKEDGILVLFLVDDGAGPFPANMIDRQVVGYQAILPIKKPICRWNRRSIEVHRAYSLAWSRCTVVVCVGCVLGENNCNVS